MAESSFTTAFCATCRRTVYLGEQDTLICPVCAAPILGTIDEAGPSSDEAQVDYRENGSPLQRVLIVDDDEEIRDLLRLLFDCEGFGVVGEAEDGFRAVELARVLKPALVVLDYRMPRMNGAKTARRLREISPDVKIVAFSAVLDEKPPWADAFLNKERVGEIAPLLTRLVALEKEKA
jgi:CheY-like chemotaxis protein